MHYELDPGWLLKCSMISNDHSGYYRAALEPDEFKALEEAKISFDEADEIIEMRRRSRAATLTAPEQKDY